MPERIAQTILSHAVRTTIRNEIARAQSRAADEDAHGVFVTFSNGDDFVQFAVEADGLLLDWPGAAPIRGSDRRVEELLRAFGFRPSEGGGLRPGEFSIADGGLNAQFGNEGERAASFAVRAFESIYAKPISGLTVGTEE